MVKEKKKPLRPRNSVALQCQLQLRQIKRQYARVLEANDEMAEKIEELKTSLVEACAQNRLLATEVMEQHSRQLTEVNQLRELFVQVNNGIIDALRPLGGVSQILIRQIQVITESNVLNKMTPYVNAAQPEESAEDIYNTKKETRQTMNKALRDLIPIQEESPVLALTPPSRSYIRALPSSGKKVTATPDNLPQAEKSTQEETPKNEAILNVSFSLTIRPDERQNFQTPSPYASLFKRNQRGLSNHIDPDQLQYDSTILLSSDKELKGSDEKQNAVVDNSATSTPVTIKTEKKSPSENKENDQNPPNPSTPPPAVVARRTRSRTKPKKYGSSEMANDESPDKSVTTTRKTRAAKKTSKRSISEP